MNELEILFSELNELMKKEYMSDIMNYETEEKCEKKKLAECQDCSSVFDYVPRKKICTECKKKKRYLRQKDYAKRDYVVAKRKIPSAIDKKREYDLDRRSKQKRVEDLIKAKEGDNRGFKLSLNSRSLKAKESAIGGE